MNIRHKVEFQLAVQGLSYEIQAYVFDTKFDIILGRQWLCQAQPVPNWSTHQWLLNSPAKMETVVLTPCAGPGSTQMVDDQDLHYVISKKQLQRYSRKRLVEEVFLNFKTCSVTIFHLDYHLYE
ncbi:hypothetical protein G6F60_014637 [Rhizopus arrhizus]|nr:hypothetical protein G6F60_014637 [Rhizopus arrhizus]